MKKSAIEQLIERIKGQEFHDVDDVLDVALVLRSKEQAEQEQAKSRALASLLGMPVIENALLPKGTAFLIVQEKGVVTQMQKVYDESEHPSPKPSESELVRELRAMNEKYLRALNGSVNDHGITMVVDSVEEILSKHTKEQI